MTNESSQLARQSRLNNSLDSILKTLKTANSSTVYTAAVGDLKQAIADYDNSERTDGKGLNQQDFNAKFYGGTA